MLRVFKHYIPYAVLGLAALEFLVLLAVAEAAWVLRAHQIGMNIPGVAMRLTPLFSFAIAVHVAMIAVGVYSTESLRSVRFAMARILVGVSLGIIFLSILKFLLPDPVLWRSITLYAMLFAIAALFVMRSVMTKVIGTERFRRPVLVLGAGPRAARIASLAAAEGSGFGVVGHVDMRDGPTVIAGAVDRAAIASLADHAVALGAREVVMALEERRNALPLADLLRVKTTGVHVIDFASFIERETGRIDLATTNPSWLIFSDGFSAANRLSKGIKRAFDIVASLTLLLLTAPVVLLAIAAIRIDSRGPAFYRQSRVGLFGELYDIVKLRSMRVDAEVAGEAVWAAENDPRVTRVGRILRTLRIDELPQTWCVLKGDMSFVGPRPERPSFVAQLESALPYYAERHMVKPGMTGWAQINYPYGASVDDARVKLEYDLYYAKNYSPFLDVLILLQTVRVVLWPAGAR